MNMCGNLLCVYVFPFSLLAVASLLVDSEEDSDRKCCLGLSRRSDAFITGRSASSFQSWVTEPGV